MQPLEPIRFTRDRRSIPIAHCKPKVFNGKLPDAVPIDLARTTTAADASTLSGLHWQDSDVAMADATEGERDSPGVHLLNFIYSRITHGLGRPVNTPPRCILVPRNFDDLLPAEEDINPSNSTQNGPSAATETESQPQRRIQRVLLTLRDTLQTVFNTIGLSRQYPRRPSYEPDKFVPSTLLASSSPTTPNVRDAQGSKPVAGVSEPPHPFPNMTIYRLMTWMNSGNHQKSQAEVTRLVKDVIQAEDFNPEDLNGFSVRRSLRALDNDKGEETAIFPDDWVETDVNLNIPTKSKDDQGVSFSVTGFHYRPLLEVIRSAFSDIQANAFHLFPFKRLWKDSLDDHEERVFDELYTSDSWLAAQDDLQRQPKEPGCSLDRVIAGLMFFSDATHLENFGTAKAWPLYLYFGNLSKYARSAPNSGACHLVGFFPSVGPFFPMSCKPIDVLVFSFQIKSRTYLMACPAYQKAV
jgi:Plavaka transposase